MSSHTSLKGSSGTIKNNTKAMKGAAKAMKQRYYSKVDAWLFIALA